MLPAASMLRLLHDIIYNILAWNCPLRLTTLRKLLPFGSFRLGVFVVSLLRPCSAITTCDSVCVHTTATNNILFNGELKVTQPHIRRFDIQQLPCPRAHSEPCGIEYPRLWFAVVAYFTNISTSGDSYRARTGVLDSDSVAD